MDVQGRKYALVVLVCGFRGEIPWLIYLMLVFLLFIELRTELRGKKRWIYRKETVLARCHSGKKQNTKLEKEK